MTGREFRTIRLGLGLTQEALATRLEMERTTIYRWEHRKKVPEIAALAMDRLLSLSQGAPARRKQG